jgi:aspartate aminotransferase
MLEFSERAKNIEESKSVKLSAEVERLRAEGKKIIAFHLGELNNPTPSPILEATKNALYTGQTRYSLVPGIKELRSKLTSFHQAQIKAPLTEKNFFLSNGSKQVIYSLFQILISPGDEVIIPRPYWVTFPESVKLAGGVPVFVDSSDLDLDLEAIKKACTKKTKAIIFNSPNNPSGLVFSKAKVQALAEFCYENKIWLMSDEAYEQIVFEGHEFICPLSLEAKYFENTVSIRSFSKSYCMTGFRMGYLIANEKICHQLSSLQSHVSGNNCTFAQYGALAALSMDKSFQAELRAELKTKRDLAYKLALELFPCPKPQGGFFIFADVSKYMGARFKDDIELAHHILKEANVSLLPGSFFGKSPYLRISFSPSLEDIKEGFARMKEVL